MYQSLIRKELYEDDYLFNEQEYKEFNIVRQEPYWKIRGTAYALSLNMFGTKEQLTKRIQNLLYQNYLHKKPESKNLQDFRDADIDVIFRTLRFSSGQFDGLTPQDLALGEIEIDEKVQTGTYPWHIIPELAKMNKKSTYNDALKGIASLMRSCSVFYDHFKDDEALTAVVALPYSPAILDVLTPPQIIALCRAMNMTCASEGAKNAVDFCKQKLLDVFYAVEDIQRLHGVTPCHSPRECSKLSSIFCANHCCKICCQELQNKSPCILHDTFDQFLRYKVKQLYHNEENVDFDKSKTLRILFRKSPRKHDLEQTFAKENVNWGETKLFYHYSAMKIQYVYLVFTSAADAQKVYSERHIYELKLEKFDCQIQSLSSSLWKKVEKYSDPDTVIAIIRPLSTLDIVTDLPTGQEYLALVNQLIQTITQLQAGDYVIEEDINPITEAKDQQQLFIVLPNREYVDRVYNAQPFMGCILAHKISHIQLLPFKRYHANLCLMCTSKREHNCLHDLCKSCCSRQQYGMLKCPCSYNAISEIEAKKEELLEKDKTIIRDSICDKCLNTRDTDCVNGLCLQCCRVQAIKSKCPTHDMCNYARKLLGRKETAFQVSRRMIVFPAEAQIQLRNCLANGDYDWFRPIFNTHVMQAMIKANRELQEVKDSGSIIRGLNTLKNKKEGKIFTHQANDPLTIWVNPELKVYENISKKGQPYVEYTYGVEACTKQSEVYVKNGVNKYRTYSAEEYEQHINSPSLLNIRNNSFHLLFIGLDRFGYSVKDLITEIHQKLSASVGKLKETDILILDNETLLMDVYTQQIFLTAKNLDQNLVDLGRVACVRFENTLDALAMLSKETTKEVLKINLPLVNNLTGEPLIYPSAQMVKYLADFNFNNFAFDYESAGNAFKGKNKEIAELQNQIQNLIKLAQQSNQGGNNKRPFNNNNKRPNNNNKKGGPNNAGGGGGGGGDRQQQQGGPNKKFKKN